MTTSNKPLLGGMEGGGTKFICAVGHGPDEIVAEIRYATTNPEETLSRAVAFFQEHQPQAIGLAPFGPLDLDPASPSYGSMPATPKAGWTATDILGPFREAFDLPLVFDLDVNAAAFGEFSWVPANQGLDSLVYYTIGTGIGAGIIVNGSIIHGLTHPEAGHIRLPHDWAKDPFPGVCPFHGDCFEGLATGPSLAARWGQPGETIPEDHPAWDLEGGYIAAALVNTLLTVSPQRIVLGGGVMDRGFLFPLIRSKVKELLHGYVVSPVLAGELDSFIVPPGLGKRAGVLGALAMAASALEEAER